MYSESNARGTDPIGARPKALDPKTPLTDLQVLEAASTIAQSTCQPTCTHSTNPTETRTAKQTKSEQSEIGAASFFGGGGGVLSRILAKTTNRSKIKANIGSQIGQKRGGDLE